MYERKWKLGPFAKKKETLKGEGKLDKFGRVNEETPEAWKLLFGQPEVGTSIDAVASKLGVSKVQNGKKEEKETKPARKASVAKESSDEEEEQVSKKDKKKAEKEKKKDKKDKKKKDKKKKKSKDSSDEESSD